MAEVLKTNEEVQEVVLRIGLLLPFVRDLNLEGFLATIGRGEAIVPLLDPTYYMKNAENASRNKRLARGLLEFKKIVLEVDAEMKKELAGKSED